jgi:hypothetical protein
MPSPATLAYWEGVLLLGGIIGVVVWKLASGELPLDDLFEGSVREADGTYTVQASAGRMQTFWVTIIVAGSYLLRVINDPHQFPDVSDGMLGLLAGSHALYLGGKAQGMLLGRFRDILGRTS